MAGMSLLSGRPFFPINASKKMKLNKFWLWGLLSLIVGCGHGFEGEYAQQIDSRVEVLNAFARIAGDSIIVIGPNYIDSEGVRTQFKEIFVRESGSQKYLVFVKDDGTEEAWKVKDRDTLIRSDGGLVSVVLQRINKKEQN